MRARKKLAALAASSLLLAACGGSATVSTSSAPAGSPAIKAANGNIEDKTAFAGALHKVSVETIKGPVKLDQFGNVVQNTYIYQTVKNGATYSQELLDTYKDAGQFWDRSQKQIDSLKLGTHKGQWVGMTRDKVVALQGS